MEFPRWRWSDRWRQVGARRIRKLPIHPGSHTRQWGEQRGYQYPLVQNSGVGIELAQTREWAAEESGGGGDGERTCISAADVAGIASARTEHRVSDEYVTLSLEAPTGDKSDEAGV